MIKTPLNMTIHDLLSPTGSDHDEALFAPGKPTLSYKQLYDNVIQLSAALNSFGIGRGDRVAMVMGNGPETVVTFLAVAISATAAPLNPNYKKEEFAYYYEDTKARALITLPGSAELAREAMTEDMALIEATPQEDGTLSFELIKGQREPRPTELAAPEDVAMILHTSGTTGAPKRVPLRHSNIVASANNIKSTYNLTKDDTGLCVMPLFHIHGIIASTLSTLAAGGKLVCPPGFSALEFWSWVDTYKPTWYSAVPTMHQTLLARAESNKDIIEANPFRFIRSSSSPLPPVILERMEEVFKAPVLEAYGMSEACHQMASNPLPPAQRKPGSVGIGFGVEVGIMDEEGNLLENGELGEVVVKGPNIFSGYEENPEANAEAFANGWFRTGDQGFKDEDGYLSLTGRFKEIINRGGEKISPIEVDDVLLRHPAVSEAIAFAVPSKVYGEDIHAAVVLKGDADEKELRAHCSAQLADFKVPRRFHIVDEIPRGATSKIQRVNLAELLGIS
ncbi:acyl--CoA ligase [Ammoniphilus oxalaticus]|nr:acyl--CoA ligase [Ammoniphilus oxalaticus]